MDLTTYALSKKYTDKVAGEIITNKDEATEGQVLISNGDGTSTFGLSNSDLIQQIKTPVATYTHSTNLSAAVSAIDYDTNTFTSVGHPFANGKQINPVLNLDAGNVYLPNIIPGGLTNRAWPCYYVVNKADDTFQLALTSGGEAIDITTNANTDLAKWHFERVQTTNITINNLTVGKKCRVVVKAHGTIPDWNINIYPNNVSGTHFMGNSLGLASYPITNVYGYYEFTVDYSAILTVLSRTLRSTVNTTSANVTTAASVAHFAPAYSNQDITSITVAAGYLANGATMEVYDL